MPHRLQTGMRIEEMQRARHPRHYNRALAHACLLSAHSSSVQQPLRCRARPYIITQRTQREPAEGLQRRRNPAGERGMQAQVRCS